MAKTKKQEWMPLNEAITDFTEINGSHYNTRVPNFSLLPTRKFVKFAESKITAKLMSQYNMNGKYIPITTYGKATCDPDNIYTKGYGIDLAFRKASEEMEKQCKQRLIAYSKDYMQVSKKKAKKYILKIQKSFTKSYFNIKFEDQNFNGIQVYYGGGGTGTYKICSNLSGTKYFIIHIRKDTIIIKDDLYKIKAFSHLPQATMYIYTLEKL